jgi:hypothetical protein
MKEILYRNSTLSLIATNLWTIFSFFIFYFEEPGFMHGFSTLIFYMYSSWIASGIGIILIFSRKFYFKVEKQYKLKFYFLYLLTGIFNAFFSLLFITLSILSLIEIEAFFTLFLLINFIVSIYIYFDISKGLKKNSIENTRYRGFAIRASK